MRETASKCQYATLRNFSMRRCSVKSNAFPPGSSVHGDSLGKNTRVVLRVFFQGSSWIGMKSRSCTAGGLYCLSQQLPKKWVLTYTEDAWFVYFCLLQQCFLFPVNISVPFLFTWKQSRIQVLSERKKKLHKSNFYLFFLILFYF